MSMLAAVAAGLVMAASARDTGTQRSPGDTIVVEVGSPRVNGRIFAPHAARVRVFVGDSLTNEWINELTLGDSAGRPVMRWVTRTVRSPNMVITELRQTYDAVTLAPYGYSGSSSNGAYTRLAIAGREVRGSRRAPTDTVAQEIRLTLDRPGFIASASDLVPVAVSLEPGTVMIAPVWGPGMAQSDRRVFTVVRDTIVDVEGTRVAARKVEERRHVDRSLVATWYLTEKIPYMVYGEVPLADGRIRRMFETEIPMSGR